MRIVTDGELFAIEKGWIFKKYLSLYNENFCRPLGDDDEFSWGPRSQVQKVYDDLMKKKRRWSNIRAAKD